MKKNLFLAALASVALVSCVNDESNGAMDAPKPLAFNSPVLVTQTRAGEYTPVKGEILGDYSNDERFVVFCNISEGTFNGWETNYFNANGEVAFKGTNESFWGTNTQYYWPLDNKYLTFAAYSPAKLNDGCTVTYGPKGFEFKNFAPAQQSQDQYDLMYTQRYANRSNDNNGGSAVTLNFKHALSSIVFSAEENVGEKTYKINSLRVVGNIHDQATFKQNIVETKKNVDVAYSETENAGWDFTGQTANLHTYIPTFDPFDVPAIPDNFTEGAGALLLIPQDVPDEAYVEINFTVTEVATSTKINYPSYKVNLSDFKLVNGTPISTWIMGKRYIYRITFGGTRPIYFKPTVDSWGDPNIAYHTIGNTSL